MLAPLIGELEVAVRILDGEGRRDSYALMSDEYQITRALLRAVGQTELAWLAGDVALVFMSRGRTGQAMDLITSAATALEREASTGSVEHRAVWGSLMATGAVIAADQHDGARAADFVREAEWAASVVAAANGMDPRTGFGTANVAVHRVSVAVEFGPVEARRQAARVVFATLPEVFLERRAALHIDVARSLGQQRAVGAAVLHLLGAERIASEEVRHHVLVRELVQSFLRWERRRLAVPELRPLAERLGVCA